MTVGCADVVWPVTVRRLARIVADGVPADGLQHAGKAVLRCSSSTELRATATTLIGLLSLRDWTGDPELTAELEHVRDGTTSGLLLLAVDLDDIGDVLDQSPAIVSYIDLANVTLWPGELFEIDQGPDDFDPDDPDRWLPVVGGGSNAADALMDRFITTIDCSELASRLQAEINGSGAFRRFQAALSRHDERVHRLASLP